MENYYIALLLLLTAMPMVLHASRGRITLGPFFGIAGVYSIVLWQMLQTGWWVRIGSLDFNGGLTLLIPPILLGSLLTSAFDGLRTSRSYLVMVGTACLAAWAFSAFREWLSRYVPLPYLVVLSNREHLGVIGGLVLAQPLSMIVYTIFRRRNFLLSLPLSLIAGILCWLVVYSITNYGVAMGFANLKNELLPFLLSALPSALALTAYGGVARRMGLVMPERSVASLFRLRRTEPSAAGAEDEITRVGERRADRGEPSIVGAEDEITNQDRIISELKFLNRSLATSARLMEYHMAHATYGIVVTDEGGRILRTNLAAQKLLEETDAAGKSLPVLLSRALQCDVALADLAAGREGKRWGGGGEGAKGSWFEIIVTPLKESDRRAVVTGYYCLLKDVSGAVRAEARNLALRRVRDLNQAGKVLGHDFSNLLIGAEAQLKKIRLKLQDPDSIGAIATLSAVLNSARDMLKQLGSGNQFGTPSLRTGHIAELLEEAISICRGTAEEGGVKLLMNGDRSLRVEADRTQMVRVFTNLLKNAIRASPAGATVSVAFDRSGNGVRIVVADEGHGMSSNEIDRAFDPGFSTKGEGKGGLGLAISYLMVEAHGGNLDLQKNPAGRGICAVVWLAESRGFEEYADLKGKNVIVASANPDQIQDVVAQLERNAGCYVAEAHNEDEILALLDESQAWDAMIMDENLDVDRVLHNGRAVPKIRRITFQP